jgi:hypothetical protein
MLNQFTAVIWRRRWITRNMPRIHAALSPPCSDAPTSLISTALDGAMRASCASGAPKTRPNDRHRCVRSWLPPTKPDNPAMSTYRSPGYCERCTAAATGLHTQRTLRAPARSKIRRT